MGERAGPLTITGGVVSTTDKIVLHVALLPEGSVAVTTMVCWPKPTSVPAAGFWLMPIELAAEQESVATACETRLGTATKQLVLEEMVTFPGQVSVGGVVSRTVTTTLTWADAPQGSVTLRVTTLV